MSSALLKYSLANSSECSKSQPLQTIWFGLVNAWTNSWYRFLEAFVHICGKQIEACPSNAVVRVPSPKDRDCMQILGLNIDREMDSSPVLAGGSAVRISAIKTEMQLLQYNNSNTHTRCRYTLTDLLGTPVQLLFSATVKSDSHMHTHADIVKKTCRSLN